MVQWLKELTTKPEDLRSIIGTHEAEGENWLTLFANLHMYKMVRSHSQAK